MVLTDDLAERLRAQSIGERARSVLIEAGGREEV
jgi:hypothetical protein